ncbi:sulfurase [Pseudooceanicola sp. CBS1P-1]|uniref:Sulfurase n=1 Tax=Pseudooceanicola albus TaxID=2692189 RepID=A0A6L7FZL9_9RHOB|nr:MULTISPECIES: MOSC domain-containing protein [Pseudooceanicola]MBT9382697.1 sulfurase [Pseudooceanicola endophyticus]MXN17235.1 sulfurase [Pseudooceanicola albus]
MAALVETQHVGRVVWLGRVADRAARLASVPVARLELGFDGPSGEAHGGLTRGACSRVAALHPRGTEIRNVRQLSLVSAEELREIAVRTGLEQLDPALLGATVVVEGIGDFSHLPPSSRLQAGNGTTLVVDMENLPCQLPAREIEAVAPGRGKAFRSAARGRRGITAWVERPGALELGAELRLFVPAQRGWAPGLAL